VGTPYYYVVTAVNSAGETTQSAQVTATPTPGNQTLNVTWAAVSGAASYKVYRSTATGSYVTPALAGSPTAASFSDTGVALAAGAPPATNTSGRQTVSLTWTTVAGATGYKVYRSTTSGTYTTPALAASPASNSYSDTGAALTAGSPPATNSSGSQTVTLSWTAVTGATGYKVYRSTTSGNYVSPALAAQPATNSYSDTGGVLLAGAPPASNTAAGNQTVTLTWTAVTGAASYKVYRSLTSGSYLTPALAGNPLNPSFSDTGAVLSAGAPPAASASLLMEYLICEA
jgi:fibronectin type 3 domain-containing protein